MKNTKSWKRNRSYKEEPNRKFRTGKTTITEMQSSVDGLTSRTKTQRKEREDRKMER